MLDLVMETTLLCGSINYLILGVGLQVGGLILKSSRDLFYQIFVFLDHGVRFTTLVLYILTLNLGFSMSF